MASSSLSATLTQPGQQMVPVAAPPRVAVAGVSGYAGGELARLLLRHPRLQGQDLTFLSRAKEESSDQGQSLSGLHPQLGVDDSIEVLPFSWERLSACGTNLLLLATPHEHARKLVPQALEMGLRVIDLSAAWRLRDSANRRVYHFDDDQTQHAERIQAEAVYGSPELHKDAIASARLVANPGCYATSVILALAPLLRADLVDLAQGIVCDAKSGVSGAGKAPSAGTHFMYAADNLSAYSVFGHRHTGELLEQLELSDAQIQFTPHLLPIPRGILSTIYCRLKAASSTEALIGRVQEFYRDCPFVRVRTQGTLPQIQHVVQTNRCDLGLAVDRDGKRVILVSCLDNLLKGAAGQAIQNMNLMYGWGESEGLL